MWNTRIITIRFSNREIVVVIALSHKSSHCEYLLQRQQDRVFRMVKLIGNRDVHRECVHFAVKMCANNAQCENERERDEQRGASRIAMIIFPSICAISTWRGTCKTTVPNRRYGRDELSSQVLRERLSVPQYVFVWCKAPPGWHYTHTLTPGCLRSTSKRSSARPSTLLYAIKIVCCAADEVSGYFDPRSQLVQTIHYTITPD